ncbi:MULTISPECIES: DUF535 family protein [unclassified Massilia]|uniref:DUF535 family protein n=1 Tax=unclassified Massilia TaxID=2609279 RepID=UPI00068A5D0C|nr:MULTISPECIES: DUF535 family protein [unclassified Massilia]ALK99341.2 hypothetical protein AM586_03915 [Massilia sp. WG5]
MVFSLLARHWLARRHYPLPSWLACIARSLRVLLFWRAHLELLALDIHRGYVALAHDDVFHHLSHRHYLAKGMSLRQRVRCVLAHYRFEEAAFDAAYKRAVYRDGGLALWRHEHADDGWRFEIRLEMASRLSAEGDLTIAMRATAPAGGAAGVVLHRLSFSWADGAFAGCAAPVVPFIACNQGRRADAANAFAAFEQAFPNNSSSFFCFAALQGIAQALGFSEVMAVKSAWQSAWTPADARHFTNAYDGFWATLGGVPTAACCWRIALPFYLKPLSEMPSKHRKRAALRRRHWQAIGEAARLALARHRQ